MGTDARTTGGSAAGADVRPTGTRSGGRARERHSKPKKPAADDRAGGRPPVSPQPVMPPSRARDRRRSPRSSPPRCATGTPATKAPAGPGTGRSRRRRAGDTHQPRQAPLRGRHQGRRGAGQVGQRDDAALERKFQAAQQADPNLRRGRLQPRRPRRAAGQARPGLRAATAPPCKKKPSLRRRPRASPASPAPRAICPRPSPSGTTSPGPSPTTPRAAPSSRSCTGSPAITIAPRSCRAQALIRDPKNLDAYKTLLRSNLDRKQFAMAELVGVARAEDLQHRPRPLPRHR